MSFIDEFKARGYFFQCTNENNLSELLSQESVVAYIGFDCTAKSLHVGSLMQIMILRLLQKYGHKPIALLGGATTKIGDPTGKDKARKVLSDQDIDINTSGINNTLAKFVDFDNKQNNAMILNNNDWLKKLNYIEFLRDVGKYFSINRMLTFDSVSLRLEREQNLSFLEFNYMLLQAYDFVELQKEFNCRLQIGGSDQWGNIVCGIDLNRRMGIQNEIFGLTTPLITTSSGQKMGKTVDGAVWLDSSLTSSYDYYQFWRNVDDKDVFRFLKLFTDLTLEKIDEYNDQTKYNINQVKEILAFEATKICHGEEAAFDAQTTSRNVFAKNSNINNFPSIVIEDTDLEQGVTAYSLFVKSKLCVTGGEAKRLISSNGAKINDQVITDHMLKIDQTFLKDNMIKLSAGKKKHIMLKFNK